MEKNNRIDVFDDSEGDIRIRKARLCGNVAIDNIYRGYIDEKDFKKCNAFYKRCGQQWPLKIDDLLQLAKDFDAAKYNGPFDWIHILDSNVYESEISSSTLEILDPDLDSDDKYYLILSQNEREKLGHNDYWYWIEDEEPSKNTFEFVQSIRKYKDKVSIFLITVDEEKFKYKYQFAGCGKFDFKQSICQGRLVFRRLSE